MSCSVCMESYLLTTKVERFLSLSCMQINIADKEHAKYVENHVPRYIWKVNALLLYMKSFSLSVVCISMVFSEVLFCSHSSPKMRGIEICSSKVSANLRFLSLMQESKLHVIHLVSHPRYPWPLSNLYSDASLCWFLCGRYNMDKSICVKVSQ